MKIAIIVAVMWSGVAMAQESNVAIGREALNVKETASVGSLQRRYTLAEIDQMRGYVESIMNPPCIGPYGCSPLYGSLAERREAVESRLRTYMQNGTDPDELSKRAEERTPRHPQ